MSGVWYFGLSSDLILWAAVAGVLLARVWRMRPR